MAVDQPGPTAAGGVQADGRVVHDSIIVCQGESIPGESGGPCEASPLRHLGQAGDCGFRPGHVGQEGRGRDEPLPVGQ
jgi:hypothetical protein